MADHSVFQSRLTRRELIRRGAGYGAALPAASLLMSACGGGGGGGSTGASGGTLEYWWWAEADAPGANKWMKDMAAKYKARTGTTINIVEQQTDTMNSNFEAAIAAGSGPDLGSQWATGPVLSRAWADAVTPIDDLIGTDETSHWLFTEENRYGDHLWAMPIYIIGQPFVYNKKLFEQAGLDPEKPPATWDELLSACEQLKGKGITPLGLGNKDTFGGRWMFAFLAVQTLDSLDDLRRRVIGEASFTDPEFTVWMERLKELVDGGYFNDDVGSLDFGQGFDVFGSGKAAMSWATEGAVRSWADSLGEDAVAPTPMPRFADKQLAQAYTATQSTSFLITSWSKSHEQDAAFFKFLHEAENIDAWWAATSVLPADDRFDQSKITGALSQRLVELATSGPQIWLENWIPPELDETANGPGGQILFTGGSVNDAAQVWERQAKAWRAQNPDVLAKWQNWDQQAVTV